MGIRLSKSARRRQADREDAAGTSSGSLDSDDGRELAPPEMLLFLETASGARWLADILLGTSLAFPALQIMMQAHGSPDVVQRSYFSGCVQCCTKLRLHRTA